MLEKLISGGQTGAEQAAWRAARFCNIPTGGWIPKGFLTEAGPRPEFAELYGALEMPTDDYRTQTEQNLRDGHATLWFGSTRDSAARKIINFVRFMGSQN
jgi:hypothetical protein